MTSATPRPFNDDTTEHNLTQERERDQSPNNENKKVSHPGYINVVPLIRRDMVFIQEHQEGRVSISHEDLDGIVLKAAVTEAVTFLSLRH